MSETTKTITLPVTLTVTYSVDKCVHEKFNGEHSEKFDLSKLSDEDITQYLAQTLIIKRQSMCRAKGAIDTETGTEKLSIGTWTVPAPGKRIAVSPMDKISAMVSKLTEAQKEEIAKKMGFTYIPVGLAEPDAELEKDEES